MRGFVYKFEEFDRKGVRKMKRGRKKKRAEIGIGEFLRDGVDMCLYVCVAVTSFTFTLNQYPLGAEGLKCKKSLTHVN